MTHQKIGVQHRLDGLGHGAAGHDDIRTTLNIYGHLSRASTRTRRSARPPSRVFPGGGEGGGPRRYSTTARMMAAMTAATTAIAMPSK
jgi:hypothetical protein